MKHRHCTGATAGRHGMRACIRLTGAKPEQERVAGAIRPGPLPIKRNGRPAFRPDARLPFNPLA